MTQPNRLLHRTYVLQVGLDVAVVPTSFVDGCSAHWTRLLFHGRMAVSLTGHCEVHVQSLNIENVLAIQYVQARRREVHRRKRLQSYSLPTFGKLAVWAWRTQLPAEACTSMEALQNLWTSLIAHGPIADLTAKLGASVVFTLPATGLDASNAILFAGSAALTPVEAGNLASGLAEHIAGLSASR